MQSYTTKERAYLDQIKAKLTALRMHLNGEDLGLTSSLDAWFEYIATISAIQGNISNYQSFLATLLVKRFLLERFQISQFDAAEKAQGAPGLDIDVTTDGGERIVGEIKTTVPYAVEKHALGSAQETSFRKDFEKLNKAEAVHKFFFVTDPETYEIVLKSYASDIPGVEVVLLTQPGRA